MLNLKADQVIRLLDMEVARSIGARYQNARIPKGMPRMFTTNRRVLEGEPIFANGCNREEQEGIDSRLLVTEYITTDLRKNPAPTARGVRRERDLPQGAGLAVAAAAAAAEHSGAIRQRIMVQSDEAHVHVHESQ